jgi:uncharacterized membrane protein
MQAFERYLTRWRGAGLIDDATVAAIRAYESKDAAPSGRRWQVTLALVLGGILLGAGILLFVAAHWDDVSPSWRLTMVLGMVALLHGAGIVSQERFAGFATAMHALGTVSAGAAIALVGQIFNMQEHWPAAVMLWALCAVAGWWLLRDEFQQMLALLLIPAWLVSEWSFRAGVYEGANIYLCRLVAVIAVVYLTAFLHSRRRVVFWILFSAAGVALMITGVILADGWQSHEMNRWGAMPVWLRVTAIVLMAAGLAFGRLTDRLSILPGAVVAGVAFALPWTARTLHEVYRGGSWTHSEPSLLSYVLAAGTAVFLAWWGVRERSKPLVNYGIGAFALAVMWFYFSSVMDKLGRSLGLIALGVLFLAGGWLLEKMRRRLIGSIHADVAGEAA